MSRTRSKALLRGVLPVAVFGSMLAACAEADNYLDRRDTISFHAGDAIASNIIAQTIDPWPRVAGNRDININGEIMEAAGERYRTGKVIKPRGVSTSDVAGGGGGGASE